MPGEVPGGAADLTKIQKAVMKAAKKAMKQALRKAFGIPEGTKLKKGLDARFPTHEQVANAVNKAVEAIGAALRDGPPEVSKAAGTEDTRGGKPFVFIDPSDVRKIGGAAGDTPAAQAAAKTDEEHVKALRKIVTESEDELA